eukprot:CAMPEP_0198734136 /NCGR_PEP_ID=MMETSP1475-20131203/50650_1 /TAXON_ID= ORGANISM="Unidentified sp., Strain CCMP1999" /NCGR_SAMPLE_ID=MMETSP1475 /ASSEMBLY_ACC=CAM_ASM_001111 /LENGTH=225 /DNA_ID=CAMNT_0044497549 /DNA_START=436 /DNA_END=1113 /DNA_ORIENTATION=+
MSGSSEASLSELERLRLEDSKKAMIKFHLEGRDITDKNVLSVMEKVPRHEFVPKQSILNAYGDHPLPLDSRATISQPYIVALMTQLAKPQPHHRALDVGTGSGYQAAILANLVSEVYSVEISSSLATSAADRLKRLGYSNIHVKEGDGHQGWKEHAPYDIIIVAASPSEVPQALVEQLAPGGRLIIPVGVVFQRLDVIMKGPNGEISRKPTCDVSFVPLVHQDPK